VTQTINGTPGNDTLTGTDPGSPGNPDGIDIINGLAGNDMLSGLGGDDTISGGLGTDILDGGAGFDTLTFTAATAAVWLVLNGSGFAGEAVGDTVTGFEAMIGSAFNDIMTGDGGANTLDGRDGGDVLDGGAGDDRLRGGATGDVLRGSAGTDTAVYDDATGALTVNLQAGTTGGWAQGDVLTSIENLIGSAFADTLRGEGGVNVLDGGAGDDLLEGRAGADTLLGGAGTDTATYVQSTTGVTVDLASGVNSGGEAQGDVLQSIENLTGSAFADTLRGDAGANGLDGGAGADLLDGGAGIDTARYSASAAAVTVDLRGGTGAGGDAQGDVLQNIENLVGSAFSDILQGNAVANVLSGGDGNDLINGYGGADTLDGGDGIDTVYYDGSAAAVTVDLRTGTGTGGDAEGDTLTAIENIVGSAFGDLLHGNAGANAINGGDGEDRILGYAGADVLNGGAGIDTVYYDSSAAGVQVDLAGGTGVGGDAQGDTLIGIEEIIGSGFDDVFGASAAVNDFRGGGGNDTLSYAQSTTGIIFRLGGGGEVHGGWADGDRFSGIEGLIGSAFADTLSGDAANNTLDGGAGDDAIAGEGSADTLVGGAGIDTAWYDNSGAGVQVSLVTGTGAGGHAQGDTLSGIESLVGSAHNDTLTGDGGANGLRGGNGDDLLRGGAGADALTGGAGVDTADYATSGAGIVVDLATGTDSGGDAQGDTLAAIENLVGSAFADRLYGSADANALTGGDGDDQLRGGAGGDVLTGGNGLDFANYQGSAAAVSVDLLTGATSGGDAAGDTLTGIENLYGSRNADQLTGDNGRNIIGGELGDDILTGNGGDDSLTGEAGNDALSGGDGADRLVGGAGVDTIHGGIGNDSVDAGSENDQVFGEAGNDALFGGAGADRIDGGDGNDQIEGAAGADTIIGGAGIDTASYAGSAAGVSVNLATGAVSGGDAAGDTLSGIEQLLGSGLADTLTGDANANTLWGRGGGDVLTGGGGGDALKGGAGSDRFVYAALSDSAVSGLGKDGITDFSTGDRIDLSAIDADGNPSNGNAAFSFGTGAYTGQTGELRVVTSGAIQVVYADANGDKAPDFAINVIADHALTAADFVL